MMGGGGRGTGDRDTGDRGAVLLNALVLVAVLSAVGVALLARAETARHQQGAAQAAAQVGLLLDAGEALAMRILAEDRSGAGAADHPGEPWAAPRRDMALEPGALDLSLRDLQGLFNLNWLADPEDAEARAAWDRLARSIGLPPARADAVARALDPGAGGGALVLTAQLGPLAGLDAGEMARLAPFVAALPGDSALNVNTASAPVLAALLPELGAAQVAAWVQRAGRDPWLSTEALQTELALILAGEDTEEGAAQARRLARFGIGSDWFEAALAARLDGRVATRATVLRRAALPRGAEVAYRQAGSGSGAGSGAETGQEQR